MSAKASGDRGLLPPVHDVLIAAVLTLAAQLETWFTGQYDQRPPYAVAALAMTVPLAWRRLAPVLVTVLTVAVLIVMAALGDPLNSAYIMAVLILGFYSVGAHLDRLPATLGWLLGIALLAVLISVENGPGPGDFLFIAIIVTGAWLLATMLRSRAARASELENRASRLERDREAQARAAVLDERGRIARELHDIVAHSLSIVVVQTSAVRRRLRDERPAEADTLLAVEETTRQALQEMRRLLGVLRTEEDPVAMAPQPGLAQLDRLLEQMGQSGLEVQLQVEGTPRQLAPGIDLVAYRVVQESLVNVLKHAGDAQATVVATYDDHWLELSITDNGPGVDGQAAAPGHGLIGMRERVALYGGSLSAGDSSDGGFAVRARLPLGAS